jgi:hypothetical protein
LETVARLRTLAVWGTWYVGEWRVGW